MFPNLSEPHSAPSETLWDDMMVWLTVVSIQNRKLLPPRSACVHSVSSQSWRNEYHPSFKDDVQSIVRPWWIKVKNQPLTCARCLTLRRSEIHLHIKDCGLNMPLVADNIYLNKSCRVLKHAADSFLYCCIILCVAVEGNAVRNQDYC